MTKSEEAYESYLAAADLATVLVERDTYARCYARTMLNGETWTGEAAALLTRFRSCERAVSTFMG